jgi:hypothetical protein
VNRSNQLAATLEQGARELAALAGQLTDIEWGTRIPHDGRTVGVVVHHVASMYPIEIEAARTLAAGKPIVGLTWAVVDGINAKHAAEHAGVTISEALDLLRTNSAEAAAAIRSLGDAELDRTLPISLYGDAPLTCQFMLEDHAVRHSFHHLAKIRAALVRERRAG